MMWKDAFFCYGGNNALVAKTDKTGRITTLYLSIEGEVLRAVAINDAVVMRRNRLPLDKIPLLQENAYGGELREEQVTLLSKFILLHTAKDKPMYIEDLQNMGISLVKAEVKQ